MATSNMYNTSRPILIATLLAAFASVASAQYNAAASSTAPYVLPTASGWSTVSLLTVNDSTSISALGGYKMAGIPDGLGAYDNGNGTFTVLMNHELGATVGVTRAHGYKGSFVSEYVINKANFAVLSGGDLITNLRTWDTTTSTYVTPTASTGPIGRLCSADLPAVSAFYNSSSGLGTQNRIFMNGEEVGAEGRAFAHIATGPAKGTSYELPRLGKFSWENSVANPGSGDKTVVLGTDDATPGQVYLYVGDKTNSGTDIEKAGLTNGTLRGIKVTGVATESRTNGLDSTAGNKDSVAFTTYDLGNVASTTGAALQTASVTNGVTEFLRPEDITWNPVNSLEFYFVTTDRFDASATGGNVGASRLYKGAFTDNTFSVGTLSMLIEGSGAADGQMFDNLTVSADGTTILIQEDPGSQAYLAKIWSYTLATDTLTQVAGFDSAIFSGPTPLTIDEESSGVIDISDIVGDGSKYYLMDAQVHTNTGLGANTTELVENGQLFLLTNNPNIVGAIPEPSAYAAIVGALGLGLAVSRRRRPVV
jgi:Bacterial protein of unknown function (DUF839)